MSALLAVMVFAASTDVPREVAAAKVAEVRRQADALDAKKRGGKVAPLGRALKQLGPHALLPMLEALQSPALEGGPVTEGGRLSLTVGLLEAVGALRDARALPVLEAFVASRTESPVVTRAAAEAYGFMQTDAVAARLVQLAEGADARARAVRDGMGSCRRVVVARALAAAAESATEVREQVELARALSDLGNAWAWKTPGAVAKAEEAEVRLTAARALVAAFVRWSGDARQAANNALMVVDAPQTPSLIAAVMSRADAATHAELLTLQQRFERNPTR